MILPDGTDILASRAVGVRLGESPGASSFFAAPSKILDPHLFMPDNLRKSWYLRADVRTWLLSTLYQFWSGRYVHPREWSTVWIAGSGATYQWDAPRSVGEPGDLDILIGVDFPHFWEQNPSFRGVGEGPQSELFNEEFRSSLSPTTSRASINGGVYETTWYVNPGATDIRDINPYAAYNVSADEWTVLPPDLAPDWDPERTLPKEWWSSFTRDADRAFTLVGQFNTLAEELRQLSPSDPHWINHAAALHSVIGDGAALFDEIHSQRHDAFKPGAGGYSGYQNVRWQQGKHVGYLHSLHTLKDLWTSAHADAAQRSYGHVPIDAAHALTIATLVGGRTS